MADRLGRKTAGRMVRNLAARFDADLLTAEERAFRRVESLFDSSAAQHTKVLAKMPEKRLLNGNRKAIGDSVATGLTTVLIACEDVAADLIDRSLAMAAESIVAELTVCERTLPGRFRGVAAAVTVDDQTIVAAQQGVFLAYEQDVAAGFRRRLGLVFGAADRQAFLARLFSPQPIGERGFAGRGIWWQACSGVKAGLRDISINASTRVRSDAMDAFNTVGADRG